MVVRQNPTLHQSPPWWLWPNILSLDAPFVTFVWQWWFAKTFAVRLDVVQYLVLFLVVWLLYALDRWLDAWKLDITKPHSSRHAFYLHHRWSTAGLWLTVFVVTAITAFSHLPRTDIANGLWLLLFCLLYFALVHIKPRWQVIPKEAQVGVMVSLGTTLCFWQHHPILQLMLTALCFALLISLNCVLIAFWEWPLDEAQSFTSITPRLPQHFLMVFALCLMGLSLMLSFWQIFYIPIFLSTGLLLLLQHRGFRLEPPALRVLADAVLLTPLLWLLVAGF